jgi:stearoyl-CoA desaturase (delta-9 desaturase)
MALSLTGLPINTATEILKSGDTSRNFLPVDFLMMGESYHNNHHKNGSRANFGGIRWHEIDPTFQVMRLLDTVGIIRLKRHKEIQLESDQKAKAA